MTQLGDFNVGASVSFFFTTHAQSGAPIAPSSAFEAADLRIYKNGSDVQRTSANGITMTSPFDSLVGLHGVIIDLSDNTDAGFYAAGSRYAVVLNPDETVDSLAVISVVAYFSIEIENKVNVTKNAGSAITATAGIQEVKVASVAADAITASALAASAVNEIADQVWDEALSGHLGAGSTGEALNAAGSAGDPWTTALPGAYSSGQAGKIVGDIGADTNDIQTRLPAALVDGRMDSDVGHMQTDSLTLDATATDFFTNVFNGVWGWIYDSAHSAADFMLMISAVLLHNSSGHESGHPVYRNYQDDADIVEADVDEFGNRTNSTLNP